jgi:DNA-binding NarL/FixJ family response regulator
MFGKRRRRCPADTSPVADDGHARVRILIVDDDDVFRDSLRLLLEQDQRVTVVSAAGDGAGAATAARDDFDVALVDVIVGHNYGFEIVQSLRMLVPRAIVLMMSGLDPSEYAAEATAAGAHGVIDKGAFVKRGADAILDFT